MKTTVLRTGLIALFVICGCALGVTKKIWPVGDSNTRGWTSDPARFSAKQFDNYRQKLASELKSSYGIDAVFVGTQTDGYGLKHDGWPGRFSWDICSTDSLSRWLTRIGPANAPDIIIIMLGTNDIRTNKIADGQGVCSRVVGSLKKIKNWYNVNAVSKTSTYQVYIGNVPPFRMGWNGQMPPGDPMLTYSDPWRNYSIEWNVRQVYQKEVDWRIGAGDDPYAKYNLAALVDIDGWALGFELAHGNGAIWAAPCDVYQNGVQTVRGDYDHVHFNQNGYDVMAQWGFAPAIAAGVNKTNYNNRIGIRYTWTDLVAPYNPCQ